MVAAAAAAAVAQVISTMALGTAAWSRKPVTSPSGPCPRRYRPSEASPLTGLLAFSRHRRPRFPEGDFLFGESLSGITLRGESLIELRRSISVYLY